MLPDCVREISNQTYGKKLQCIHTYNCERSERLTMPVRPKCLSVCLSVTLHSRELSMVLIAGKALEVTGAVRGVTGAVRGAE